MDKFPILNALINSGVVHVEDGYYVGKASDGEWVTIGWTGDTDDAERYLKDHPTPDTW